MTFFFAIMLSSQLQTKIQAHFHVYAPRLFQSYNWNPICTSLITCTFVPKSEDSLKNTSPKMFFTWECLWPIPCTLSHLWDCVCIPRYYFNHIFSCLSCGHGPKIKVVTRNVFALDFSWLTWERTHFVNYANLMLRSLGII